MILLSLAACNHNRPPKDILQPEEIVPVLIDMHLVNSIQSAPEYRTLTQGMDSVDVYSYIFEKHGIDRVEFDSSIAWYSRNPELFTQIYDHVVMRLTQISDSLNPSLEP